LDKETWEGLCNRCGLCCFEKIEDEDGRILYTQVPCRYLDIDSRQCKIYNKRFKVFPECVQLTPELVGELKWLPRTCGYKTKEK
jgi:uncharacterized cysteine cluster protein YcgN (CxxCxxCC family)